MAKTSKAKSEAAAKAALRQRVEDIFTGAAGYTWDGVNEPCPTKFMTFVRATKQTLGSDVEVADELTWGLWCLQHFRNPETATEWLYRRGIRA